MSVSSILAFVLAGVAAKNRRADRQDENQELIALRVDNADLRRRVADLEDDVARANVQFRRDQELIDIWRERALANAQSQQANQGLAQYNAQSQQANQRLAQQNAQQQQAQLAQQNYAAYQGGLGQANIGLLGAQNLIDAELWCNCVPSRSQVWAADRTE